MAFLSSRSADDGGSSSGNSTRQLRVTLVRNGKQVELGIQQVTVENLRKMFQVNPADAWLREETDQSAYFPNEEGLFADLQREGSSVGPYSTLVVEGSTVTTTPLIAAPRNVASWPLPSARHSLGLGQSSVSSLPGSSTSGPPYYRSVTAPKKPQSSLVRIVKAGMYRPKKGSRLEFSSTGELFIEMTELTATVVTVRDEIKKQWGSDYTIVSSEGLEIEDSVATRCLNFWKCPRRKLYAVTLSDIDKCGQSLRRSTRSAVSNMYADSSSDDELEEPAQKKRKYGESGKMLRRLSNEMASMKDTVMEFMSLTKDTECDLPMGFRKLLKDTFKCNICQCCPITPPVIVTKCCKNILGCQVCVDTWYSGEDAVTKTCPICRHERGCYETMVLPGLSSFIEGIKKS